MLKPHISTPVLKKWLQSVALGTPVLWQCTYCCLLQNKSLVSFPACPVVYPAPAYLLTGSRVCVAGFSFLCIVKPNQYVMSIFPSLFWWVLKFDFIELAKHLFPAYCSINSGVYISQVRAGSCWSLLIGLLCCLCWVPCCDCNFFFLFFIWYVSFQWLGNRIKPVVTGVSRDLLVAFVFGVRGQE